MDRLSVHVGQRYSVIVEANQTPQNYYMRAELDEECFLTPGVITVPKLPEGLGRIQYQDGNDTFEQSVHITTASGPCQDMNPKTLENYYPQKAPSYNRSITLTMRFGKNKENELRGKRIHTLLKKKSLDKIVYDLFLVFALLFHLKGFLNNVTFNTQPQSPTLLNIWSVQDALSGENLVYYLNQPQYLQLVLQGQ